MTIILQLQRDVILNHIVDALSQQDDDPCLYDLYDYEKKTKGAAYTIAHESGDGVVILYVRRQVDHDAFARVVIGWEGVGWEGVSWSTCIYDTSEDPRSTELRIWSFARPSKGAAYVVATVRELARVWCATDGPGMIASTSDRSPGRRSPGGK